MNQDQPIGMRQESDMPIGYISEAGDAFNVQNQDSDGTIPLTSSSVAIISPYRRILAWGHVQRREFSDSHGLHPPK